MRRAAMAAAAAELHHAGIRSAATAVGVLRGSVGFLAFLVAFALRRQGAPSWVFGLVLAASMGGSLVGAAVAPRLRRHVIEEHVLAGTLVLVLAGAVAAARLGGRPAAVLLAVALGVGASAGKLAFDSLVQRDAADAVQGRTFARFEAAFQLSWVAGALVPVVVAIPLPVGYVVLALASAVTVGLYVVRLHAAGAAAPVRR